MGPKPLAKYLEAQMKSLRDLVAGSRALTWPDVLATVERILAAYERVIVTVVTSPGHPPSEAFVPFMVFLIDASGEREQSGWELLPNFRDRLAQNLKARVKRLRELLEQYPLLRIRDTVADVECILAALNELIVKVLAGRSDPQTGMLMPITAFLAHEPSADGTQREILEKALVRASGLSGVASRSHNLELILRDYLVSSESPDGPETAPTVLRQFGQLLGLHFIAIDPKDGKPAVGADLLWALIEKGRQSNESHILVDQGKSCPT